ncbi:MAG: HEAT repeat domain-containing protein [Candidatus Thorarchaeota archaeon]
MSYDERTRKLLDSIKKTDDENSKFKAIDEIGEIGKKARIAVPDLVAIVKDTSASFNLRSKAIWSLGEIGSGAAVQPLLDQIRNDKHPYIRILSLESLGKIGLRPERVLPQVQNLIENEPLPEVRNRIPKILSKFGSEAIPVLIDLINNSNGEFQCHAILALGEITGEGKKIIPFLKGKLSSVPKSEQAGYALALVLQEGRLSTAVQVLENLNQEGYLTLTQQSHLKIILEKSEEKTLVTFKEEKPLVDTKVEKKYDSDLSIFALERINKILFTKKEIAPQEFLIKNYSDLVNKRETGQVEFKSALRFNKTNQRVLQELEIKIIRTVIGFMNAKGGILLIGVNDTGEAIGLDGDYSSLGKGKQNSDGFKLRLNDLYVIYGIKVEALSYIETFIEKIDKKEICIITVIPADKPVTMKNKNELIVRMGNSTRELQLKEASEYMLKRFGGNNS